MEILTLRPQQCLLKGAMISMTVKEVREIRERQSLETIGMTVEELNTYYGKGAAEIQKRIDALRAENTESTNKEPIQATTTKAG